MFTGTIAHGIQPQDVGRDVTRQYFQTRSGTEAPMGLLTEVIYALELEQSMDEVPMKELASDLTKLAIMVKCTLEARTPLVHYDISETCRRPCYPG